MAIPFQSSLASSSIPIFAVKIVLFVILLLVSIIFFFERKSGKSPTTTSSSSKPQHHQGDDQRQRGHGEKPVNSTGRNKKKNAGHLNQKNKQNTVPAEASSSTVADDGVGPASARVYLSSLWRSFASFVSKNEITAWKEKVTLLEEENKRKGEELERMQEKDKKFSSELQGLLGCLNGVEPSIASPNGDDPAVIFFAVLAHLTASKNKQSYLSEKVALLEEKNSKISEYLDTTKVDLRRANSRASAAEKNLTKCSKEKEEFRKKAKKSFMKKKCKVREARNKAFNIGHELQNCKTNLKAAEEKALEQEKVIGDTNTAILDIEFPVEIVSTDISHKVGWLADEHKKTCEDLGSTKADLQHATFRADTAEKDREQANHEASSKLSAMEANYERAKEELDKCCTESKAAELKVEMLKKTEHVNWLAGRYNNSVIGRDTEEAISRLRYMKSKIDAAFSETVRGLLVKADVEATRAEYPDSGTPSDASDTEFMIPSSKILEEQKNTDQDMIRDVEQGSGSGESTIVEFSCCATSGLLLHTEF